MTTPISESMTCFGTPPTPFDRRKPPLSFELGYFHPVRLTEDFASHFACMNLARFFLSPISRGSFQLLTRTGSSVDGSLRCRGDTPSTGGPAPIVAEPLSSAPSLLALAQLGFRRQATEATLTGSPLAAALRPASAGACLPARSGVQSGLGLRICSALRKPGQLKRARSGTLSLRGCTSQLPQHVAARRRPRPAGPPTTPSFIFFCRASS